MPTASPPVVPGALPARRLAVVLVLGAGLLLACERPTPPRPAAAPPPVSAPQPAAAQEPAAPQPSPVTSPDAGASLTPEQFDALVEAAQGCAEGEACALAGAGQCLCAQAVNASRAAEVDAAAARVDCGGAVVRCRGASSARCEAGRCVAVEP
ncbi:MAG TPA: hypothetical protein VFO83_14530 [Aggregicoccus sp.]|nr:hypothetical protein [Aggregicoccus sp.]